MTPRYLASATLMVSALGALPALAQQPPTPAEASAESEPLTQAPESVEGAATDTPAASAAEGADTAEGEPTDTPPATTADVEQPSAAAPTDTPAATAEVEQPAATAGVATDLPPSDETQQDSDARSANDRTWRTSRRSSGYDPYRYRSSQFGAFELRFGRYVPDVDDEFGGDGPYQELFGDNNRYALGFEVDYQALRLPYFGTLGAGFGLSYTRASAPAPLEDGSGDSAENTSLWILPMYVTAVLRVDVLAREVGIPLVPYGKLGLSYALWHSGNGSGTDRDDAGVKGEGAETGYQWALGAMLLLNVFHPQAALDMDNSTGINAAYLFGEWMVSDVDSFGSGMQVGTNTWVVGLAFEF